MTDGLHVFVALEGGGAKGLVHIGALKALEERGVSFRGLAGTSAGAIVAALKAAGYSADDMVDPVARTTLLAQVDPGFTSATDFFGRQAWSRISIFRNLLNLDGGKLTSVLIAVLVLLFSTIGSAAQFGGGLGAIAAVFGWLLGGWYLFASAMKGLASVHTFRRHFDTLLRRKMLPAGDDRPVTFRDFGDADVPSLKIVATNLSKGELQLFSPELTPGVPVADAVAASVCLPVIFEAWIIDRMLHFDGGLVSNLPAWTFDEERMLDPDATTIAVEITSPITNAVAPTARRWLMPAIKTAVFGSSVLNKRGVGRFEAVALDTGLDLLGFDAPGEIVFQAVSDATAAARVKIVQSLYREPEILRDACATVRTDVENALKQDPLLTGDRPYSGRLRVAIALRDEERWRSLRLKYSIGYDTEDDTDEEIVLPIRGSRVGAVYESNEAAFHYFRTPGETTLPAGRPRPTDGLDRWRKRLIRRDVAWLLCIPVECPDAKRPAWKHFIAVVDCDQSIDPASKNLANVLALLEPRITTIFRQAVANLDGAN